MTLRKGDLVKVYRFDGGSNTGETGLVVKVENRKRTGTCKVRILWLLQRVEYTAHISRTSDKLHQTQAGNIFERIGRQEEDTK